MCNFLMVGNKIVFFSERLAQKFIFLRGFKKIPNFFGVGGSLITLIMFINGSLIMFINGLRQQEVAKNFFRTYHLLPPA